MKRGQFFDKLPQLRSREPGQCSFESSSSCSLFGSSWSSPPGSGSSSEGGSGSVSAYMGGGWLAATGNFEGEVALQWWFRFLGFRELGFGSDTMLRE